MNADDIATLERKIDLLIRLLGARCVEGKTTTDAIRMLGRLGLDRPEIATICDTTPNTVSVRLSEARKKSQSSRRPNERTNARGR
jgi:hypothetical protein